jgi:hypothetical protein
MKSERSDVSIMLKSFSCNIPFMSFRSLYRTMKRIEEERYIEMRKYIGSCSSPSFDRRMKKYESMKAEALSLYMKQNPILSGAAGPGNPGLEKALHDAVHDSSFFRDTPEGVREMNRYLREITGVRNTISGKMVNGFSVAGDDSVAYGISDLLKRRKEKIFTERLEYVDSEMKRLLNVHVLPAKG